ncbi:hypothetical protein CPB86DRAFT_781663 [Serendipita vermifera]|nr:hypothetical protein CPB86DRAFT_781663 [Serendipita vermifera]
MDIRAILQHPQFEILLNTLSLRLDRGRAEAGQWISCRRVLLRDPRELPCACDELDIALGVALNNLLNLKALRLYCLFCESRLYERHRYLTTLQTNTLQELRFSCACAAMDEARLVEYLGAPCMAHVTTLSWRSEGDVSSNGCFKASLSNPTMLPNLRNLYYGGSALQDLLLLHRPIQQVGSASLVACVAPKYKDLRTKRGELTHLSIQAHPAANPFFNSIAVDPFPFRNLQHLGAFRVKSPMAMSRCIELQDNLRPLVALQRLVSVEAKQSYGHSLSTGSVQDVSHHQIGLNDLSRMFPDLRRVYFTNDSGNAGVWVYSESWKFRKQLTSIWGPHPYDYLENMIWNIPI